MADEDGVYTTEESIARLMESIQQIDETNWGPWKLDRSTRNVYIEHIYFLSITDLTRPMALFDSLRQVEQKTWADNECLGGLVRAAFEISRASADPIHEK